MEAASGLIFTPMLFALFSIQVFTAAPLGRVHCITLPCSCAALRSALLALSSSSTTTINTVLSGRKGTYSARPFSKPALVSVLLFAAFFPFLGRLPFSGKGRSIGDGRDESAPTDVSFAAFATSAGADAAASSPRFFL